MECFLCRKVESKRRLVHSATNAPTTRVLVGLLNDIFNTSVDSEVIPKGTCLCYACFRSIEKTKKMRDDLHKHTEQLRPNLETAGEACGLRSFQQPVSATAHTVSTPSTPRTRKRSAPDSQDLDSPATKRRATAFGKSTPVRQTLSRMVPTQGSPAVAVSC